MSTELSTNMHAGKTPFNEVISLDEPQGNIFLKNVNKLITEKITGNLNVKKENIAPLCSVNNK